QFGLGLREHLLICVAVAFRFAISGSLSGDAGSTGALSSHRLGFHIIVPPVYFVAVMLDFSLKFLFSFVQRVQLHFQALLWLSVCFLAQYDQMSVDTVLQQTQLEWYCHD